jgi:hypothetical protein
MTKMAGSGSISQRHGSGSVPKCHGSATLLSMEGFFSKSTRIRIRIQFRIRVQQRMLRGIRTCYPMSDYVLWQQVEDTVKVDFDHLFTFKIILKLFPNAFLPFFYIKITEYYGNLHCNLNLNAWFGLRSSLF